MDDTLLRFERMPKGRAFNVCVCLTCPDEPLFDWDDLTNHIHTAHGLPRNTPCARTLLIRSHMADFWCTVYGWTFADVEVQQFVQMRRSEESRERWIHTEPEAVAV